MRQMTTKVVRTVRIIIHFKNILINCSPLPSIFCYWNTGFSLALWNIFDRHTSCPHSLSCAAHLREQLCAGGLTAGPGAGGSRSEGLSMKASRDGSSSSDCPRSSVKMNQDMILGLLNSKVPIKLPAVHLRCQ